MPLTCFLESQDTTVQRKNVNKHLSGGQRMDFDSWFLATLACEITMENTQ